MIEGNQTSLLSEFVCSVDFGLADLDMPVFVETNFSSNITQMELTDVLRDIFTENPSPIVLTAILEKNNTDEPELIMEFDPVEVFQSKLPRFGFFLLQVETTLLNILLGKISPVPDSEDKIDENTLATNNSSINTTSTRQPLSLTFSTGADRTQSLSVILSFLYLVAHIH